MIRNVVFLKTSRKLFINLTQRHSGNQASPEHPESPRWLEILGKPE